jgi:hypothetical protein
MKSSPIFDAPQMVLTNTDGHLFLTGDGNSCHEQHLGLEVISDFSVKSWSNQINLMSSIAAECESKFCFFPAPDKQSVYWESLSDQDDNRNILKILDVLNPKIYYDCLPDLKNCSSKKKQDIYPKVDTHWSSYGGILAIEGLLSKWGIQLDPQTLINKLIEYEIEGDLGAKTVPRKSGVARNIEVSSWKGLLIYDNSVPDNGRIRIFNNQDALHKGRLVLVGDSFSYRIAELLCHLFETVYHFHGQFIDRKLVNLIQPNYFLFEQTERFFIREPKYHVDCSFFRIIEEKIESGVDVEGFINKSRTIPKLGKIKDIHQALVIDLSENHINRLINNSSRFCPNGLRSFVQTIKLLY